MNKKMKFKKLMFIAASTLALGVAPAITMSCNFYIKSNPFLEYLKDKSENLSFYKKTPYWLQKNAKDKTSDSWWAKVGAIFGFSRVKNKANGIAELNSAPTLLNF